MPNKLPHTNGDLHRNISFKAALLYCSIVFCNGKVLSLTASAGFRYNYFFNEKM